MLTCRNKIIVAFSDASSGCEEVLLSRIHGLGVWAPEVVLKPAGPARTLPLVFFKKAPHKNYFSADIKTLTFKETALDSCNWPNNMLNSVWAKR